MKFLKTMGFINLFNAFIILIGAISMIVEASTGVLYNSIFGIIVTSLSLSALIIILIFKTIYVMLYVKAETKIKLLYIFFTLINIYFIEKNKNNQYFDNSLETNNKNIIIKSFGYISLIEKIMIISFVILFALSSERPLMFKQLSDITFTLSILLLSISIVIWIWTFIFKVVFIYFETEDHKNIKMLYIFLTLTSFYLIKNNKIKFKLT
ncbi:hypothetical protein [Mesomycoplasma lagogenitalium]|uniref:Uncharacterized protein n=1 Tax=Mesomycoplasma lagogenitalium TaxID=171286 RepID=A0ABY8LVZ9_9BACT|nr:hypothetical protein [Mesomycoplasma lagogenitalium]WGI36601.1 hypothetical protein QEG99_04015 [Mesomycoplasma lagogenitalium]